MDMMQDPIKLEEIVESNLFWENPNINFIAPFYDGDFEVLKNGNKTPLRYSINNYSLFEMVDINKMKRNLLIQNLLFCFVISFLSTFLVSALEIGPTILFKESGYWKYIMLQLSILSAFLFGFSSVFELFFYKQSWSQRCILNSNVMRGDKIEKCNIDIAREDLKRLLSNGSVSLHHKNYIPFGDRYFEKIVREIEKVSYKNNIFFEYNKALSKISCSQSLLKSIVSLIIAVSIEAFSFIDLYADLIVFRTNMIASAILILFVSLYFGYVLTKNRFEKAYIKLDALLYLYSYMFLEMPYDKNKTQHISIDIGSAYDKEGIEALIAYKIYQFTQKTKKYVYFRQVEVNDDKLLIYGFRSKEESH